MITQRIDRISHIPPEYLSGTPPVPRSVKIELSGRCNYRCAFCALSVRTEQPKKDMDFELFKRITREMRELGVEEIGLFFIGESFMNPPLLISAIQYLKQELQMPYVFLTSNASLASSKWVRACMSAGLDSLKWSMNFVDREQFAEMAGVRSEFLDTAKKNIQDAWNLRETLGYATKLYASSIRYDGEQYDRMLKMLKTDVIPFVDEHYWLPLYSMGSLATHREEQLGYRPSAGNVGRYDNPVEPLPCWSLFTEAHVLSDGRLSACCFDATGQWVMGDLQRESFMSAWHSEKFMQLRHQHLERNVLGTPCASCALYS